ncbi:hypothetical protein F2Q69_00061907 [Brassica cretica]|uniref:Uncharacterized protein n=1 Tax=Brassica cretica TaxID=69181 RepID=A0A8S9RQT8_BRACR|nr:hypothetical protein F2Q69_00061907 [Brassica cretica]
MWACGSHIFLLVSFPHISKPSSSSFFLMSLGFYWLSLVWFHGVQGLSVCAPDRHRRAFVASSRCQHAPLLDGKFGSEKCEALSSISLPSSPMSPIFSKLEIEQKQSSALMKKMTRGFGNE